MTARDAGSSQDPVVDLARPHAVGPSELEPVIHEMHHPFLPLLKRARPRMLHVLERPWNDDAVMVTAIARPDADQFVGLGIDEGNPAG